MSGWEGPAGPGAMRERRKRRQQEALARQIAARDRRRQTPGLPSVEDPSVDGSGVDDATVARALGLEIAGDRDPRPATKTEG